MYVVNQGSYLETQTKFCTSFHVKVAETANTVRNLQIENKKRHEIIVRTRIYQQVIFQAYSESSNLQTDHVAIVTARLSFSL